VSATRARKQTKAVLLAAGLGTRLRPITDTTPKCLVEIAGRPLLDYWFGTLAHAGIRDVLINTHHLPDPVRRFIGAKNQNGFRCVETFEPVLRGSAGTIAANRGWADDADDVVIVYADNLSDVDLATLVSAHRSHGEPITMLLFRAPNPKACGIAELDPEGRVTAFEEKPTHPKSDLANAGVYVVTPAGWCEIADMKALDIGFDVLPKFLGRIHGHAHRGYHLDIGDRSALAAAQEAPLTVFRGVARSRSAGGMQQ
jgi:NDP-sugar pyrophosphorylase family protein